ncbi:MAG: GNAT family N-acetyltransferase [Alphaproteobacteria bacterium]
MPDHGGQMRVRIIENIAEADPAQWDACANPAGLAQGPEVPDIPFLAHAFLLAMEKSGSVSDETGWAPRHILLESPDGTLLGAIPMYLKSHSYGEYVFDHSWADAFHRAGGQYYPKLQVCVPFTPAPGRRILVRPHPNEPLHRKALIQSCTEIAEKSGVSSLHFTFLEKDEWETLGASGYMQRTHYQFHWLNQGYKTFDDFLNSLNSRKRKQIRKERREAVANGVEVSMLTGGAIKEAHWDAFYRFYLNTGRNKWGQPYLTREFFSLIGASMPDKIALVMCSRAGRLIAGAINFIGGEALFGRNWGCIEEHPFLHFEACYYQAIEFAIARGLPRVEAGAQGAHKLARGYLPNLTYSAHWIKDRGLRKAVGNFLTQERAHVIADSHMLAEHSPFRNSGQEEMDE